MERVNKPLLGSDSALWAETRQSPPPKLRGRHTAGGSCCNDAVADGRARHSAADQESLQGAAAFVSFARAASDELSVDGGGSVRSSVADLALRPPLAVFCNPLWHTN